MQFTTDFLFLALHIRKTCTSEECICLVFMDTYKARLRAIDTIQHMVANTCTFKFVYNVEPSMRFTSLVVFPLLVGDIAGAAVA